MLPSRTCTLTSLPPVGAAAALLLTLSCGTASGGLPSSTLAEALDPPSTHGMLVVGDGPVYFSHLPMFHRPHDYQALLAVTMTAASGEDALAVYKADKAASGETVYTFVPDTFSLNALVAADHPLRTMTGTLFRGHFERGGTPILDITATVDSLPHFRKFLPGATRPAALTYLLFGNSKTGLFLAHKIVKAPDFDHVMVGVTVTANAAPGATTPALPDLGGASLAFPGLADTAAKALKPGVALTAQLTTAAGTTMPVTVKAAASPYLETGDLEH